VRAILIPVKQFHHSKKRLAAHFSDAARAELVAALCEDFFQTVSRVRGTDRIFVVSAEPLALGMALVKGWETIAEEEQVSESASIDMASHHCAALGFTAALRIPIDIPLCEPRDIEDILAAAGPAPSAVLVPSRDGTGTNALLRSPPDLFASHFGTNSFALHRSEAERAGATVKILRNPHIALDIDEIEDIGALKGKLRSESATARWIKTHT
jgi:2-phospho-L-lactate guanylyltransferase